MRLESILLKILAKSAGEVFLGITYDEEVVPHNMIRKSRGRRLTWFQMKTN